MAVKKDRITLDIISRYIKMLKKNKVKFSEIYLFGSHVKGTYNPDSDIDLAMFWIRSMWTDLMKG